MADNTRPLAPNPRPASPQPAAANGAGNGHGPDGGGNRPGPSGGAPTATVMLDRPRSTSAAPPILTPGAGANGGASRPALGPVPVASARRRPPRLSAEVALYGSLLILAVVTRFWDLNARTLHHDESLHTYYSWLFATGQGYAHHPLMHGPFLFHANALVYLLFGASDATSRYMPALFGVVLVGLPYLLRGPRHLGRWGALAASTLFLVSPSLLYQSRYIRHDIYTVVGCLLLLIGIVRYLERPERRWLIVAGASLGFLLTNHEIIFGIGAVFAGVLWGALLWGRLRPTIPLHVAWASIAAAAVLLVAGRSRALPSIPWDNPTRREQLDFYRELLTHPLPITVVLLLAAFAVGLRLTLAPRRDPALADRGWIPSLLAGAPAHSVETGVLNAWRDRSGLAIAAGVGGAIFVVLYTSLFTNVNGLFTSTIATNGTLLYWLGQHDVQRGVQPWFYYLLLMPQYEFVAVLFGGAAVLLTAVAAVRAALGRPAGPRFFFQLFVAVWFVGIFAILSWAGEKMPWLVVHATLPAILLAAGLLGGVVERALAWRTVRVAIAADTGALAPVQPRALGRPDGLLAGALLVIGAGWLLLAARLSYGTFVTSTTATDGGWTRAVTADAAERWWWLALPPLAAVLVLAVGWALRGSRRVGAAALGALAVGLVLLQIHAGWRTAYLEGDVPRDMLIYTQTSPDVRRMVGELGELSATMNGDKSLAVWYDDGVSWPLQWYLRDFDKKFYRGQPGDVDEAPVVIANGGLATNGPRDGYTGQEYVLRWWFPEEPIYRNFAIAPELPLGKSAWQTAAQPHGVIDVLRSVRDSLATQLEPAGQQRVYRLLMYRDLPARIDCTCYTLYVRNDLVPILNRIRYP